MKKILEFLKNKSVGYYMVAVIAILSLLVGIIFFATYRTPDLVTQMGNKAEGAVPDTIGIFLLAGFAVELIILVVPQYRFVQLVAIVMFGLAFYKEVLIIPDFIAGKLNGVMYNGGNYELNMFYIISLFIILVASIVAAFLGFYKKEEEATADMPVKGTMKIVKVSSSAAALIAVVLVSVLVSNSLVQKSAGGSNNQNQSQQTSSNNKKEKPNPITDRIKEAANLVDYEYRPEDVIIEQQEKYEFSEPSESAEDPGYYNSDLKSINHNKTRSGHYLVYLFEGLFSEGYHGGYDSYSCTLYLWDDGLFTGNSNGDSFKGYWYNSSLENDDPSEANCLIMLGDKEDYKSIQTDAVKGFYQRQGYVHINPGWGDRSVVVRGYLYYPDVAIFIDTNQKTEFKVGDMFNRATDWSANRVIKNLTYVPIKETGDSSNKVTWTYPDGMLDSAGKFAAAGDYTIKAKWGSFEDEVTVTVAEAPAA